MANDMARREGVPCEVHVSRTPELIRAATCCMSVSGSVSLELLHHRKPTVILYHISPFANWAQRWIRKVKYITLVNILAAKDPFSGDLSPYDPHQPDADDVLFPEYLTSEDRSADLAAHVIEWLTQPARLQDRIDRLTRLDEEVGVAGASERAAEYILNVLDQNRPPVPQPHFTPAKVRQAT
jgi:lipid-A-disaccharide synthase